MVFFEGGGLWEEEELLRSLKDMLESKIISFFFYYC